jgi:ABC-2 type transport system ATP-binding protein
MLSPYNTYMSDIVLKVENLVKDYDSFRAVDSISFEVPRGKVVGFLGPNGAGKTTTIHMLLGVVQNTSGKISYFGKDFNSHKSEILQRINFASAFNTLLGRISVLENLRVFAKMYDVKNTEEKISELVTYFEVQDQIHTRYWDLSAGQKTRVNLIKSLLNDPEIILMDEPTASLDPDIADKTLSLIEELRDKRNLTILYTSHEMDEVTRICDEVIFLDHGKIVAQDTPSGLTKRIKTAYVILTFTNEKKEMEKCLKKHTYEFIKSNVVKIKTEEQLIPSLIFSLSKEGVYMTDIEINKPNLEDVFLQIARKDHHVAE